MIHMKMYISDIYFEWMIEELTFLSDQ